jgi:hypothetical protein
MVTVVGSFWIEKPLNELCCLRICPSADTACICDQWPGVVVTSREECGESHMGKRMMLTVTAALVAAELDRVSRSAAFHGTFGSERGSRFAVLFVLRSLKQCVVRR